jgi:hypothetical protein
MSAPGDIANFSVAHLPIVKEYAQRMGLVEIIDGALNCGMHTSPGKIVPGLIMNILCGRSPIYRVEEFFKMRDVPLLLGEAMTAEMFNDDAIGRVLDRIYDYVTWKLFSEVCIQAFRNFNVDCATIHQDTTSVSVWGEYKPGPDDPMLIARISDQISSSSYCLFSVWWAISLSMQGYLMATHQTKRSTGILSRSFPGSWRGMERGNMNSYMSPIPLWQQMIIFRL